MSRKETVLTKVKYSICMLVDNVEEKSRRIRSSGVTEGSMQFKTGWSGVPEYRPRGGEGASYM